MGGTLAAPCSDLDANGAAMAALAPDWSCACGGWAPDLTWSPDGRTVAVYSDTGAYATRSTPTGHRYASGSSLGPGGWSGSRADV